MSTTAQRGARGALDAARPAIARLSTSRGSEDLAADLIELWSAVEAALRTLVGSSTLSGQPLIREARQRQLIDFDQANTLAEFQAVHDRLQSVSYSATPADVESARGAYLKLDAALSADADIGGPRVPPRSAQPAPSATVAAGDAAPAPVAPSQLRMPVWMLATLSVLVVTGLIVGGYFMFRRDSSSLEQGITAYRAGQREVAVSAFTRATHEDPHAALPHIYLARMAREVGNFSLASTELQFAIEAEPNNATALREMGANLLAQGNYELARKFYVRAVQEDPTDKNAQGYLACSLIRLGRPADAASFLTRAGPGPWTSCTPATPASSPALTVPR